MARKVTIYPEAVTLRVSRVNDSVSERPVIGDRRERFARAIESLSTVRRDNAADYRDERNKAPIAGGPRSAVWPIQSGAAQSPFIGHDRVQGAPSFPGKVVAPTLAPADKRGRASVSDSPPTARPEPRAALRFASEGRRTRLASKCKAPVFNEEECAMERPYPEHNTPTPTPTPLIIDPIVLEWNRQHREALEDARGDADRRRALLPRPPAPKALPRPARPGAPTPRHGIQGVVSSSGRDLDPGRKR